eukprot:5382226-Amphidinium_carterae.1
MSAVWFTREWKQQRSRKTAVAGRTCACSGKLVGKEAWVLDLCLQGVLLVSVQHHGKIGLVADL